ncbi:T9SS type A sorting domain-containing protein [Epilithonimonas sp.]|uniref:T9SS type A sorting domain-containing protein n=1 Tax=Epilithonimonas sp. TaxID=2894511 RepID=UPI0028A05301|nr:T9SS type A sorting domain-containing protein [Epilithonimonas sp.]
MKKIYSLLAAVALTATINAQGSEDFSAPTSLTGTYADGTFAGQTSGVTVAYTHSRDEGDYAITGKGLMLRRADEPSSVEFTIPNGVGSFTFKYRKAFTGGTNTRVLAVFIDGVQTTVTPTFGAAGEDTTVLTSTTTVNKSGSVKIKISYPTGTANGNKQVTIDDVSWTAYETMAVVDATKGKANLVKNTIVSNELIFDTTTKVSVYNITGQIVKTAEVTENSRLDVSALPKGTYIVTSLLNGQAISQKIIKK